MVYNLYWGDIHSHTYCGGVFSTPEAAMEIARSHLDFCSTPEHSIGMPPNEERFPEYWRHSRAVLNANNIPGKFVTILGYEWGLSGCGDINLYFPDQGPEEAPVPRSFAGFIAYAKSAGAILIPHHVGYLGAAPGVSFLESYPPTKDSPENLKLFLRDYHMGANWDRFVPELMPVVEIFSMHGSSERDDGPFPMDIATLSIRESRQTVLAGLRRGLKFGFIASTDQHIGYPGVYCSGLMAAYATELTRGALWDALMNRRTYAVTGDRIKLDFRVNGQLMGSDISGAEAREIAVDVEGHDLLNEIDVVKNGRVWKRETCVFTENSMKDRAKVRIEWGWDGNLRWESELVVNNGRLIGYSPNFGPPGPNQVQAFDEKSCRWVSHTAGCLLTPAGEYNRNHFFYRNGRRGTSQLVFEIEGGPHTEITLRMNDEILRYTLAELLRDSVAHGSRGIGGRKVKIHQAVSRPRYTAHYRFTDDTREQDEDYYYVRVTQANGQMAWSSPIWIS